MRSRPFQTLVILFPLAMLFPLAIVLLAIGLEPKAEAGEPAARPQAGRSLEIQGKVVCLVEEMHQRHGTELPTHHDHIWSLKTAQGQFYTLLPGKYSQALFLDARVRAKELRLKGRLLPEAQLFEVTYFHSVKNGVVQDLYYYCEICAIKTVSPEPCACCQGPVELKEEPLKANSE